MLITELCKKKKDKKKKSEQYFILLFSFQVDFIASAGTVLTAVTLYCSHEWLQSPLLSLCRLPTTPQKSARGCRERLARAKDRKKSRVGVGVPGTKLRVKVLVVYHQWCTGLFTLPLRDLKLRVVKTRCSKPI